MYLVYWEGRMGCVWFIGRVGWGIRADSFFFKYIYYIFVVVVFVAITVFDLIVLHNNKRGPLFHSNKG